MCGVSNYLLQCVVLVTTYINVLLVTTYINVLLVTTYINVWCGEIHTSMCGLSIGVRLRTAAVRIVLLASTLLQHSTVLTLAS